MRRDLCLRSLWFQCGDGFEKVERSKAFAVIQQKRMETRIKVVADGKKRNRFMGYLGMSGELFCCMGTGEGQVKIMYHF